jgi:hypothetical protein
MVAPMRKSFALIACLAASLLVAGCTDSDWSRLMNYSGMGDEAEAEAPVAPAPQPTAAAEPAQAAAPSNADFCRNVALGDATRNGFDQPTQAKVFARSYSQCLAIYTR